MLLIAVPNVESLDAQHYREQWAAYDVPRHLYHFAPKTMAQLLKKHKLVIRQTLPMPLDAYYVSMLSEKHKAERAGGLLRCSRPATNPTNTRGSTTASIRACCTWPGGAPRRPDAAGGYCELCRPPLWGQRRTARAAIS